MRLKQRWLKICIISSAVIFIVSVLHFKEDILEITDHWHGPFFNPEPKSLLDSPVAIFELDKDPFEVHHHIDHLIKLARDDLESLLKRQTVGISEAVHAYRKRRHRHPPPGFDRWVAFAEEHGCLVVEELFDQIHHDINPFWAIPANEIRQSASGLPHVIRVRDGKVLRANSESNFVNLYSDMISTIANLLPDVDIPVNDMDEPRVLLPWQKINQYMSGEDVTKGLMSPPSINTFAPLSNYTPADSETQGTDQKDYLWTLNGPYWNIARAGCPPDAPAWKDVSDSDDDFTLAPEFPSSWPSGTYLGYVANWTLAKDPCHHPHLRNLHGTFVEPISISTTETLIPMFSGSKLPMNNDILLPAAVYWSTEDRFSAGDVRQQWHKKRNEVIWRGVASGGRNRKENWLHFQRHRLLSMLNGTQVQMTLEKQRGPRNFPVPNQNLYPLVSHKLGLLAEWIRSFSNAAFTWLVCFPATEDYACSYTGSWYRQGRSMTMQRMFHAKYLPDVDGNSFSGRFRAFLRSNSLPIKASIYSEWHDSRLIPWIHFVPMDNTFVDLWAILEYLFGHDDTARVIAEEGSRWASKVLRKEDMLAYVYRLILEYARVSDHRRDDMGFTDDTD